MERVQSDQLEDDDDLDRPLLTCAPHVPADSVPDEVRQRSIWPLWRRWLDKPPDFSKARVKAWQQLGEPAHNLPVLHPLPIEPGKGIFGNSLHHWHHMGYGGPGSRGALDGVRWLQDGHVGDQLELPFGPLFISLPLRSFACDITDVEGITASKSSGRYFQSVDDFGGDYVRYLQTPETLDGLRTMLNWGEVRITRGSDSLSLHLWDGRLFLANDGGSHHFAGAAFIARRLNHAVPLTATLEVQGMNEPTWMKLLKEFVPIAVHHRLGYYLRTPIARLLGRCYNFSLPGAHERRVFLLPREMPLAAELVANMKQAGAMDLTQWALELLSRQRSAVRRWRTRLTKVEFSRAFPSIANGEDVVSPRMV